MSNVVLDKDSFVRRVKKLYENWKVNLRHLAAFLRYFSSAANYFVIRCRLNHQRPYRISQYSAIVLEFSKFSFSFVCFCPGEFCRNLNTSTMIRFRNAIASCRRSAPTRRSCTAKVPHCRSVKLRRNFSLSHNFRLITSTDPF